MMKNSLGNRFLEARALPQQRGPRSMSFLCALVLLFAVSIGPAFAFQSALPINVGLGRSHTNLFMAQASEQDAKKAIDAVVKALRSDGAAKKELGKLNKVENVLGYGSPQKGKLAVRFNASFQKGGSGFLGFGTLGAPKSDKKAPDNQRGTMVGQVKASVDQTTGKVVECSVFRDLGYGRSFNLKTR